MRGVAVLIHPWEHAHTALNDVAYSDIMRRCAWCRILRRSCPKTTCLIWGRFLGWFRQPRPPFPIFGTRWRLIWQKKLSLRARKFCYALAPLSLRFLRRASCLGRRRIGPSIWMLRYMRERSLLLADPTLWLRTTRLSYNDRPMSCSMPALFAIVSRRLQHLCCLRPRRMGSYDCVLTIVSSMRVRFEIVFRLQQQEILFRGREGRSFFLRSTCTVAFTNCVCVRRISTRRHLSHQMGITNGCVRLLDFRPRLPHFNGSCPLCYVTTYRRDIVWCIAMTLPFSVFRMIHVSIWLG